jgi:hypothetical protein
MLEKSMPEKAAQEKLFRPRAPSVTVIREVGYVMMAVSRTATCGVCGSLLSMNIVARSGFESPDDGT